MDTNVCIIICNNSEGFAATTRYYQLCLQRDGISSKYSSIACLTCFSFLSLLFSPMDRISQAGNGTCISNYKS